MQKYDNVSKFTETRVLEFFAFSFLILFFLVLSQRSIWIDEAATWWIANGPFRWLFADTNPYPNHLPYYLVIWLWIKAFGSSEISMRMPSLISIILTALLCRKIILENFSKAKSGFLNQACFMITFIFQEHVLWSAVTARQYGIGILFATISVDSLLSFIKQRKLSFLLILSVSLICSILSQPVFAPLLLVLYSGALVLTDRDEQRFKLIIQVLITTSIAAFISVLYSSSVGTFNLLNRLPAIYSFIERPKMAGPINLFPLGTLLLLALSVSLIFAVGQSKKKSHAIAKEDKQFIRFLWLWALFPPLCLIGASHFLQVDFLLPRYIAYTFPAWGILCGIFLQRLAEISKIYAAIIALLFPLFATVGVLRQPIEDWRSAVQSVCNQSKNNESLVLVYSGHPESLSQSWQLSPESRSAWLASAFYYCPTSQSNIFRHIYFKHNSLKDLKLDQAQLKAKQSLFFIGSSNAEWFHDLLDETLLKYGFSRSRIEYYEGVEVRKYLPNTST